MKIVLFVLFCALTFSVDAQVKKNTAPPPVKGIEWWQSFEGCRDATNFVPYFPRTLTTRPAPAGLIPAGLPREACVLMPIPEIGVNKNGWVRQQAGAPYYFEHVGTELVPKFRKECLNEAVRVEYLVDKQSNGIDGKDGIDGTNGSPGSPGRDGKDGVNGLDGKNGIQSEINIHVNGTVDVNVHHSGTVDVRPIGPAVPPPPTSGKKSWWSGKKIAAVVAIVGGAVVAVFFATHHHHGQQPASGIPPVVTTLPPR